MDTVFQSARQADIEFFTAITDDELKQYFIATDEDQRTLLHNAVTSGNSELVEYFLNNGAKNTINASDEEGWTPLHSAASCGFERIVELLVTNGGDVSSRTSAGRTPLHYAASKGHCSIMKTLLNNGARVSETDRTGFTPLHRAAAAGKLQAVRLLVDEAGCPLDVPDNYKKTPLVIAIESRHDSIVIFLAARGANFDVELEDDRSVAYVSEKLGGAIQAALNGEFDVDELS